MCLGTALYGVLELFNSRSSTAILTGQALVSTRKVKLLAQNVIILHEEPVVIVGASCRRISGFHEVDFRLKFRTSFAI